MPDFAVKITFVFGIRIYFQDRVRMARLSYIIYCSQKKIISPCGCQRADLIFPSRSRVAVKCSSRVWRKVFFSGAW